MLAIRNSFPATRLMKSFDDLFDLCLSRWPVDRDCCNGLSFDVDMAEDDNSYLVKAEIPGIKKEDINILVENGYLSVEFTKQKEKEDNGNNYRLQERQYGKYQRTFTLPKNIDDKSISAELKDGILTLNIKKAETAKRKLIEIK